jgi:hypothetical protein
VSGGLPRVARRTHSNDYSSKSHKQQVFALFMIACSVSMTNILDGDIAFGGQVC